MEEGFGFIRGGYGFDYVVQYSSFFMVIDYVSQSLFFLSQELVDIVIVGGFNFVKLGVRKL